MGRTCLKKKEHKIDFKLMSLSSTKYLIMNQSQLIKQQLGISVNQVFVSIQILFMKKEQIFRFCSRISCIHQKLVPSFGIREYTKITIKYGLIFCKIFFDDCAAQSFL